MNLTKRKLGQLICEEIALVPQEAEKLISDLFDVISEELESGRSVYLNGYGGFSVIEKPARPGRNPKTGEPHEITERKVCIFKAGIKLKGAASEYAVKSLLA